MEFELLPKPVRDRLGEIKAFIKRVEKEYKGDLAAFGRPFYTKEQLIALLYALQHDVPITALSNATDISRVSLSKLKEKFDSGKQLCYLTDQATLQVKCETITREEVENTVQEWLRPKKIYEIKDVMESKVLREFVENPIKRTKSKHGAFYSKRKVQYVLTVYADVIQELKAMGWKYTNPDIWIEITRGEVEGVTQEMLEAALEEAVRRICERKSETPGLRAKCEKEYKVWLRAPLPIYKANILKGRVGAASSVDRMRVAEKNPEEEVLWVRDWLRWKSQAKVSSDRFIQACYWISALHVETGAREGYTVIKAVEGKVKTLEEAEASLAGLKWDNVIFNNGSVTIKVYESKTGDYWTLERTWLNHDLVEFLKQLKEYATKHGIKSVVRTILHYYGFKRIETLESFERWYHSCVELIASVTGKPKLTPHKLRASHISMLAELGVPLELAVHREGGFGAGWHDLHTAVLYYFHVSREYKEQVWRSIQEKLSQLSTT